VSNAYNYSTLIV